MTMRKATKHTIVALILAMAVPYAPSALAQDSESVREAGKHFQRGVVLYNEADYRGALVEFKRAGGLAPTASTLYNIGETQYQLQDYAGALGTFERYLAEASPSDGHRAEVERNVQALRARVGFVAITTLPTGADITIDDQPVGRTPLDKPVRVTIGQRKIVATLAGRPAVVRYIEVAAEDNVSVSLQLGTVVAAESPLSGTTASDSSRASRGSGLRTAGWVTTGVLAAGAVTFGVLAIKSSNDLKTARETYPTTSDTLDHAANKVTTYSIIADALGVGALIVGGITLYSTLSSSSNPSSASAGARLQVGFASVQVEAIF
jgi:tetratricopeptide (TPR) repeat protein